MGDQKESTDDGEQKKTQRDNLAHQFPIGWLTDKINRLSIGWLTDKVYPLSISWLVDKVNRPSIDWLVDKGNRRTVLVAGGAVCIAVCVAYVTLNRPAPMRQAVQSAIGGPFNLVDHNGKLVTDQIFRGRHMLVYFGYTYCPDVCPTALTDIGSALDMLGDEAKHVTPVFITIDPERDTPEYLREYVQHFHPRLVALTGTVDQVKAAAKAYGVYSAKVYEDPEKKDPDDYLMDHTSVIFLMGPDGNFKQHFGHRIDAETMARRIREIL